MDSHDPADKPVTGSGLPNLDAHKNCSLTSEFPSNGGYDTHPVEVCQVLTMTNSGTSRNMTSIRLFAGGLSVLAALVLGLTVAEWGVDQWTIVVALAAVAAIAERQSLELSPGVFVSV